MQNPLPASTVTFLFTDIEGSTRLWEQHPEAMKAALARHDALLHAAIEGQHGRVVKSTGDGLYAVFASAADAVNAVVDAQRALHAEEWPQTGPLRVRMALHTGEAELREEDYFGPALNRTARLMAVAAGGQAVLSQATAVMVRDQLPANVSLRDLGEHRLKDLNRSERVYQIVAPDLPVDFPPLKSLNAYVHNLPEQRTPLVGRDRELAEARQLLDSTRLLTLTGTGGTGKTRLALQLAAESLSDFADGVYAVLLAPIRDTELVVVAIAQALGLYQGGSQPLRDSIKEYLHERQMLLVLDNFEQVMPAALLVAELLASSTRLKVLVTSREALHLYGEQEYPTPPLALPEQKGRNTAADDIAYLAQSPAVALFVQRGAAVKPGFALTPENAATVVEICTRLDGLPLAIELAAAKLKLFPPQMLLSRLEQRLSLLTGGAQDLPARQRTLRDGIAWSYDLLSEGEQRFFRRLSVFSGGFTFEAAQAVGDTHDLGMDFLDALAGLVDKSLVRQFEAAGGDARFSMLETIREFGLEQLTASSEQETIQRQHAQFFLALVETIEPELKGPKRAANLVRLEADIDNLRAALAWSQTDAENAGAGLRMVGSLTWFWYFGNHVDEGRGWYTSSLERTVEPPMGATAVHVKALWGAGLMAMIQGDFEIARTTMEKSVAIARQCVDMEGLAISLRELGMNTQFQGDLAAARRQCEESVAVGYEASGQWDMALALHNLANVVIAQDEYTTGRSLFEESQSLYREIQDEWGISNVLVGLSLIASRQGDNARARALLEEAVPLRRAGDQWTVAEALDVLGEVVQRQGDLEKAKALYAEALLLARGVGDKARVAYVLHHIATLAQSRDEVEQAVQLMAASAILRNAVGGAPFTTLTNPMEIERDVAVLRSREYEVDFAASWAAGQTMTLDQAIECALAT